MTWSESLSCAHRLDWGLGFAVRKFKSYLLKDGFQFVNTSLNRNFQRDNAEHPTLSTNK